MTTTFNTSILSRITCLFFLITPFLSSCKPSLSFKNPESIKTANSVTINQAINETVGSCLFTLNNDPSSTPYLNYRITFENEINPATLTEEKILNKGTGGGTTLSWSLSNCGDNKNFKLETISIVGDGTIVPSIEANLIETNSVTNNLSSTSTDNSITYINDPNALTLTINQSINEVIDSCNFSSNINPTYSAGFSYRITFSGPINTSTFTASDVSNGGTGGGTNLTWTLQNCGDDTNFKLTASSITGDGTIIPVIYSNTLQDTAGHQNAVSTSTNNLVTFDTTAPSLTINQATTETVGTCSFTAPNDPTSTLGFNYKITFSEIINPSTFTTADINNIGTGGATLLTWNLENCGDDTNFKLTPAAITGNGTIVPQVALNTIQDIAGNNNNSSTSTDNSITFDTTSPTLTIDQAVTENIGSCSFTAPSDPSLSDGFSFKVVFSKEINTSTFNSADIYNAGTGGSSSLFWTITNCGNNTIFKLTATTVTGNGTIIPQILGDLVQDIAGNNNSPSTSTDNSVTLDSIAPNVTINQATTQTVGTCSFNAGNDPTNSTGFSYHIIFSEKINTATLTSADIINAGTGGTSALGWTIANCGDDTNFKLTANSITGEGTIVPQILSNSVLDVAGNNNTLYTATDNSIRYDITSPSITINQATTQTIGACTFIAPNDPINTTDFSYKIVFSEAINAATFTTADITNAGTGGSTALTWTLLNCGDDTNFKLSPSSISGDGTIIPQIAENSLQDSAGNNNSTSTSTDNTVTFDTLAPTIIINQSTTETIGSCSFSAPSDPTNTSGFTYRVRFSKSINTSTFTTADINNSGSGGSTSLIWTITNCGDNINFKLTAATVIGDGTIIPHILGNTVQDLAGNNNSASSSTDNSITFDATAPTVTINQAQTETIGTCSFSSTPDPTTSVGFSFRVTFSKVIQTATFTTGDIVNAGTGGATALTWTITNCGDDKNFNLTAQAITGYGTIVPQILANSVLDLVGNNNSLYSASDNSVRYALTIGWVQEAYIKAANSESSDSFGYSLSLSGDTLAVGASGEDSNQTTITNGSSASSDNSNLSSGAVYIYKRTGSNWIQEAYIKAANNDASDLFGSSISLNKDTLAVGAYQESSNQMIITNGNSASSDNTNLWSGAVYIYRRTGANWSQEAYLKANNNTNALDKFGFSVSISGDTLAVGAYAEDSNQTIITNGNASSIDNSSTESGAVYIYKRSGASWSQEAYIKASNNSSDECFSCIISLDGDTLVISAYQENSNQLTITNGGSSSIDNSNVASGAAYVYKRTGVIWAQEAYIKASNNDAADNFGYAISLNGDTLAIGANNERSNQTTITNGTTSSSNNTKNSSGAVYVYKRTGVTWAQEAYIKASNNVSTVRLGSAVSLVGDTLAVGAYGESSNQTTITNGTSASSNTSNSASGATYIYKRTGVTWSQEAYIKASNNDPSDNFGRSVSLSGDSLAVGAYSEDSNQTTITNGSSASSDNSNSSSGAVYIYRNPDRLFDPSYFISTAQSENSITLNWDTAGALASGYKIAYAIGSTPPADCNSGTIINAGNVLTSVISGLSPGSKYSFRICSYDSQGATAQGYTTTFQTSPAVPEVSDLSWVANSSSAITLNWLSGGGATSGFKVAYSTGPTSPADCNSGTVIDVGNTLSYQLTGLATLSNPSFRVCSYDSSANLSYGLYATATTLSTPEASNLYTTSTSTTVTVNWTTGGGVTNGFKVAWTVNTTAPVNCYTGTNADTGALTSYTITGLSPGQLIKVLVCSYDNLALDISAGVSVTAPTTETGWNQEAYIKASNNDGLDSFGKKISLSGDTLVVGSSAEDSSQATITNGATASSDNSSVESGAAYVYKRTGAIWEQEAYIKASNSGPGDLFGHDVSLYGDTLAVGAQREGSNQTIITNGNSASSDDSNYGSGAVYIYKRVGSNWSQEAYIKASNNGVNDYLGTSVSINKDTLAVGASQEASNQTTITNGATASNDNSNYQSGAVYIYKRTGVNWVQEAYIKAANNYSSSAYFGYNISLNEDTLAVGTSTEKSNQTTITNGTTASSDISNSSSGATYVYKRTNANWEQEAYIKASNNESGDGFGSSVSLSGDTLAVGAIGEDSNQTTITNGTTSSSNNSKSSSGAVYVYKRTGVTWVQEAYIKAINNTQTSTAFGSSVSLKGNTLAVGAKQERSNQITITNGTTASSDASIQRGAVYVYKRTGVNWVQEAYIKPINNFYSNFYFGDSISLSGDTLAVGTYAEKSNQTTITNGTSASLDASNVNSGAVYVYRNNARLFEITDLSATATSSTATLFWVKTGGTAIGYYYAYQVGSSAPADCTSGTYLDVGDVSDTTIHGLSSGTTYSFRVCANEDGSTFTSGATTTLTTP